MTTNIYIQRAERLASEMASDGHDIDATDLLDYLAVCGYQLEEGPAAGQAYMLAVGVEGATGS